MEKITFLLNNNLQNDLEGFCKKIRKNKSEVIREALEDYLNPKPNKDILELEEQLKRMEDRLVKIMIRNSEYTITNFHLILRFIDEFFLFDNYDNEARFDKLKKIISAVKKKTLYDKINGINSRTDFKEDII
jgi:metal-responsive CopG/Arc/MetJ family transcriptional regulator